MKDQLISKEVRNILLRDWDPIGVGDNPNLVNEYDSYLMEIVELIKSGCDFTQLHEHLLSIEKELGIRLPDAQRSKAVENLLNLYSNNQ